MENKKPLQYYHGGREWYGRFEINPKSSKVMEHGPGLYLTNGIETARNYAKGGGVVQLISINPEARLIDDARVHVDDMTKFLVANSIRHAKMIIADLFDISERLSAEDVPLENLINLMINYKSLVPSAAVPLNEYIVSHGVDMSVFDAPMFNSYGGNRDEWVVVYNPDVVVSRERVNMKTLDWGTANLPRYDTQITLINQIDIEPQSAPATQSLPITPKLGF